MKSLEILAAFLSAESGQDMIEYALLAGVVGCCAVASLKSLQNAITNLFHTWVVYGSYF